MSAATSIPTRPSAGQVWQYFHGGTQGVPQGARVFVVADVNSERSTLLSLSELQPVDVRHDKFASCRIRGLLDVSRARIAKRLRATMRERERHGFRFDADVVDLALSALGWKPDAPTHEEDGMISIAAQPRKFVTKHIAARAAQRALGRPDAKPGVDFETAEIEGGYTYVMKMPEKMATGMTGIERQYQPPKAGLTPAQRREAVVRAVESVAPTVIAVLAADAAIEKAVAAAKKPPKKPTRKAPKRAPKRPAKKSTPKTKKPRTPSAGPMNGKPMKNGPSAEQVRRDKNAARVRDEAKAAKGKTKNQIVADLLLRSGGTTLAEILKATNWPTVTVPGQAKAAGLKLRKEKVKGEPTRYYGTPA